MKPIPTIATAEFASDNEVHNIILTFMESDQKKADYEEMLEYLNDIMYED